VLGRSITESCAADHHNDPAILTSWLANKTPQYVRAWIVSMDTLSVVAIHEDAVVGFAMLTVPGEIRLCYLVPEAQGLGLGRAMIASLEAQATRRGISELRLHSTATAHGFYLRVGFADDGPIQSGRFVPAQPMRKRLLP
jgi:GNAT superfamily N-acetyltransferase